MPWLCVLFAFLSCATYSHSAASPAEDELKMLAHSGYQAKTWLYKAVKRQESVRIACEAQERYWLSIYYFMRKGGVFPCYQHQWAPTLRALAHHKLRSCQRLLHEINMEIRHNKRLLKMLGTELQIAETKISTL